jgi:hypothetical protein
MAAFDPFTTLCSASLSDLRPRSEVEPSVRHLLETSGERLVQTPVLSETAYSGHDERCAYPKVSLPANLHIPTGDLNAVPAINFLCRSADGDVVAHDRPLRRLKGCDELSRDPHEVGRLASCRGNRTVQAARRSYR